MKIILNAIVVLMMASCERTTWLNTPPKEFLGVYYLVSDGVIQGYEKQVIVTIKEKTFSDEEDTFPITKVSKTGESIVIFCKMAEDSDMELLYELSFSKDNYLYITQIAPTGYDDHVGRFPLGKFTDVNFLKSDETTP